MPRWAWGMAALVLTAGLVSPVLAQGGPLPPSAPPSSALPPATSDPIPSRSLPPEPSTGNKPPPVLGPPVKGVPLSAEDRQPAPASNVRVASTGRGDVPAPADVQPYSATTVRQQSDPTPRGAIVGVSLNDGPPAPTISAQMVEGQFRRTSTPPPTDSVNDFLARRSNLGDPDRKAADQDDKSKRSPSKFGEDFGDKIKGALGNRGDWFRSDHCFDGFISPVTNPFLFEDPRSLTELRPIFIFQKIPSSQVNLRGGDVFYFGTQARLAITDRLSFVFNKLGVVSLNPGSGSEFPSSTGFAELWFGPKYTIIRGQETGSLLAAGLQFQVPTGSGAFQNTGNLSLVPWLTYGQNFGRDLSFGSFNGLIGTGYSASVNNHRSDYYYLSAHIDLDVLNNHRWYPLAELNWLITTTNGNWRDIGIEGRDLINFGGHAAGDGLLTGALGARYKITESAQVGGAFEIPFAGPLGLFRYRFTIDFILRY